MKKFLSVSSTTILLSFIASCSGGGNSISSIEESPSLSETENFSEPNNSESIVNSESESTPEIINFYEPNLENRPLDPVPEKDKTKPYIEVDKTEYSISDVITVNAYNYGDKDWIGFFKGFGEPATMDSDKWIYASSVRTFYANELTPDEDYSICLLQNDGYVILDSVKIHIGKKDTKEYGVKNASFVCGMDEDGVSESLLKITPSVSTSLTYNVYWAKDGKRLDNYTYLASFTKASSKEFSIFLPEGLYMPSNANQIEVAVKNGNSTSLFVDIEGDMKLKPSNYRYSFNILTDMHINPAKTVFSNHLSTAIDDILYYNKESKALFTIGDHTDNGTDEAYELLNSIMDRFTSNTTTPAYYALGNHEFIYGSSFNTQVNKFLQYTNMQSVNYSFTLEGSKVIYLGSDSNVGEGTINDTNVAWLKQELESADASKPIYVFLHQPLIDTVAGSYKEQGWYGINANGVKIKELLKDYPNVFMFTGHTHWTFESANELSLGRGSNANYINCSAVGYLWNDDDKNEPGSEGFFVDVYDDYIVLKGREFVEQKWAAYGMYCIPIIKK